MSETSNQKALIEQLLSDRDAEFWRAVKAERQLKELSDVKGCRPTTKPDWLKGEGHPGARPGFGVQGKPDSTT